MKSILVPLMAGGTVAAFFCAEPAFPDRGLILFNGPSAAAKLLHDSDDHIDLDGHDMNHVELSDEDWLQVENPYAQVYGQSRWPIEIPSEGPTAETFAESFFGVWQIASDGFSPAPLSTISEYRRRLYLRHDLSAALRLRATEKNSDGSLSTHVLLDQLQIARIYVKYNPTQGLESRGRPVVDGMYHIDYFEDYDCPCEFGSEPFEVISAARVLASPPPSRTYFFRVFPDAADRLIVLDVLKGNTDRTPYLRVEPAGTTAVTPASWGAIKRILRRE